VQLLMTVKQGQPRIAGNEVKGEFLEPPKGGRRVYAHDPL
jgi:hypothetical protein